MRTSITKISVAIIGCDTVSQTLRKATLQAGEISGSLTLAGERGTGNDACAT